MKLINEKGKLFGIINVVDLVIIIGILAIGGAIGMQLFGQKINDAVSPQVDLVADVVIIGTPPRLLKEFERQDIVGERIVAGNEYLDAVVEDVRIDDYIIQAVRSDGVIVDAIDPSKKDVVVRIRAKVAKGTPSPKVGNQEIRAGRTYILKTQTFECSGTIDYVEIGE